MIERISRKITNRLLLKKVIKQEDWEIYQYGVYQLIINVVHIITLLILGIIFNEVWQGIIFALTFVILRIYAGGYHAPTPLKCYLLTTSIIIAVLSVMKYVEIDYFVCLILLIISSIVILIFSPVESENKPLDMMEKMIYRRKTFMIWGIETGAAIVCAIVKVKSILICITMAEVVLCFALISEVIKQKTKKDVKGEGLNEKRFF